MAVFHLTRAAQFNEDLKPVLWGDPLISLSEMDGVFLHIHLEQHQKKEGEEREEDSSKKSGISST